jgi:transposase
LSAAVKKVVLGGRELTDQMKSLGNHYLFEPCFTRVGRGNDKGGVEARGKGIRYQSLTPTGSSCDTGARPERPALHPVHRLPQRARREASGR